jgi:hypothetical protein
VFHLWHFAARGERRTAAGVLDREAHVKFAHWQVEFGSETKGVAGGKPEIVARGPREALPRLTSNGSCTNLLTNG